MVSAQYRAGRRAAAAVHHDVDWYLERRTPADAAEFERGWFDWLEDYSAHMMALLARWPSRGAACGEAHNSGCNKPGAGGVTTVR